MCIRDSLCTIMVFVICFVLTWVVTGMDAMFVNRLLAPMPLLWVICYVVAIQVEPLCMVIVSKILHVSMPMEPEGEPQAQ